ncbi:MAG: hypothetical protein ACTIJJ_13125 [Galactobacter sp.]|uniref:hypothetical protein n=1 Tax=Galactobacter sp. TaxID=2676125 RepID=UPI0025C595E2|nr:hypothetical protein [Galactobacter sp.]
MSADSSTSVPPHLPYASVAVRQVRTGSQLPVSAARSVVPAFITDLLLLLGVVVIGFGVAWTAREVGGAAGRIYILLATIVVICVTAVLLRRGAQHGRPAMWATLVCIGWGVVAALWVPGLLLNLVKDSSWAEGVFTAETTPSLIVTMLAVQALVSVIVLLPAILVPECVRGWARGFFTAAGAGLGFGGMQAVLILSGRHLVGLDSDAGLAASLHAMSLPVLQAFGSGWGGLVLGVALVKGRKRLWFAWPVAVVISAFCSALVAGLIRARALCREVNSHDWCVGSEPQSWIVAVVAATTSVFVVAIAVTVSAMGYRRARLRAAAMVGLVDHGWYTEAEAEALSTRPARRRLLAWSRRRGAAAQARSVISTADALIALRLEIEDLADPLPSPAAPRAGLVEEQDGLLQRSLSARESLRTAVAHGPGGWTAS